MTESKSTTIAYLCANCAETFHLDPQATVRCPSCLRTSGLVRQDQDASHSKPGWGLKEYSLVVLLGAAALAGAYAIGQGGPAPLNTTPESAAAASGPSIADVPEELRLNPQAVDGAVRLAAEALPKEGSAIAKALIEAIEKGNLPTRDIEGAMEGAPRAAGELAPAINGKQVSKAGSLEKAMLLGALLDAKGLGPITYGFDTKSPDAATDIVRRRYLAKTHDGPWLSSERDEIPESIHSLNEAELLANQLAWRSLADLAREDLVASSKASQRARSLAPKDAAVLFVAGQVQVLSGLAEPGISTMERAAGIAADSRTWFALGVMSAEANQPFKARQYLMRSADTSTHAEPHLLLAQLALERLATTPKESHDALIKEAEGHVSKAEERDPTAPGLTTMKAQMAALAGDMDGAEAMLRADTQTRPKDEEAWLSLFQFLLETEREREAMETLQEGVDAGANGAGIHHVLGMLLAQDGRADEALLNLKRALEIEPDRGNGLRLQMAQLMRGQGDEASALALLQEEIGRPGGETRQARLLLAQMHLDAGQSGAAKPLIDAVLKDSPDDQEARMVAYILALTTKEGAEAEKKAAIKAIGQRSNVARILLEQGFIEEGEALLKEALLKEAQDPLAPVLLSALMLGTDRGEQARELRDKTLSQTPEGAQRDSLKQLFDSAFAQAQAEVQRQQAPASPPPSDTP